ncbi:GNAT family N-acetyltransferase [Ruminococcaceae bacterium OttesenSCG-928-I18]|nr:GNAT family N-acetyltransferase [Ruminococcaceae bacterium OttesenSCG-928-I18]
MGTQPIETPRLFLRRFTLQDAPAMYENWGKDPEVTRFLRWEPHRNPRESEEMIGQWVAGYEKDDTYHWAIERREDGALVGSIGVFFSGEAGAPKGWQPAFCIGRAFWGQGYTSEALRAVLDYFVKSTGEKTLYGCHAVENPASGRVMQKNGFLYTHEGEYHLLDGSAVKAHYYRYQKD